MSTTQRIWRKSSRSDDSNCVEVALADDSVLMRDSKNPDGPVLRFDPQQWRLFLADIRANELTSPDAPR